MIREELLNQVKEQMTAHRFIHTMGVASTAVILAARFGADPEKAELAGLLHDYCKFWDKSKMQEIMEREEAIPSLLLQYDKELWHAPVGAVVAKQELGVEDQDVLNAIGYHTSGRPGMSKLEKILWLADYIEPGRQFPGVDEVRELAEHHLDAALVKALSNTITFLMKQKKRIYPLTFETYNDLVYRMNKEEDSSFKEGSIRNDCV